MASLVKRGTRADPQWHVKWTVATADGAQKQIWKRLQGIETQKQADKRLAEIERALEVGDDPFPVRIEPTAAEGLLEKWIESLTNRNVGNDRTMVRKHLVPRFGRTALEKITVKTVLDWLADMRKEATLSGQSQRHALATLSRFWGWCIEEQHTALPNPVKSIPLKRKPEVTHAKRATLEDEGKLAELIGSLPPPVDLMLALANRTGMRLGEVCGLRLSDLDNVARGFILLSHSYDGPLKEDRRGQGKIKQVPAPTDAAEALKMHLARRRLQGAGPDDLVFVPVKKATRSRGPGWLGFRKENIRDLWWAACRKVGLVDDDDKPTVTWYGATRTTAATRAAKADVDIGQIADSLGHASSELTKKHYAHFVRTDFAPALRLPMMTVLGPAPKKLRTAKPK
jgi:integrase